MLFEFDLRFRTKTEEEGRGSLSFQFSVIGHSLREVVLRGIKSSLQQHPDTIFDGMVYYSKP